MAKRYHPGILVLLALLAFPCRGRGEDWEGTLDVVGNRVVVRVVHADQTPAAGVRVVVLDGRRQLAAGLTDEQGLWSQHFNQTGAYEAFIGREPVDSTYGIPFAIKELPAVDPSVAENHEGHACCRVAAAEPQAEHPGRSALTTRNLAALGLGLAGAAFLLYGFSRPEARKSGMPPPPVDE